MRKCGECSLCCKLMVIVELDKKPWEWCQHCSTHRRCDIYKDRPNECRTFECLWTQSIIPKWLRPNRKHVVFISNNEGTGIMVLADPAYPQAWLASDVYGYLKHLAEKLLVIVTCGTDHFVVRSTGHRQLRADEAYEGEDENGHPVRQFKIKEVVDVRGI